jgi:hypothetical protein
MTFSFLLTVAGIAAVGALITMLYAVVSAPFGYQDETGFHFGVPDSERVEHSRAEDAVSSDVKGAFALRLGDCFARRQTNAGGAN